MDDSERFGWIAAAAAAIMFVVILLFNFVLLPAQGLGDMDAFQSAAKLLPAATTPVVYGSFLVDTVSAILVVLVALALRGRLMAGAPTLARLTLIAGSVGAALFVAESFISIHGIAGRLATLNATDAAAASAAFGATQIVGESIFLGAVFTTGWMQFTAGWGAVKSARLPVTWGYLSIVAGLCGILGPWIFVLAMVGLVLNVFWAGWLAMVLKKG